jgi:hypothetical protein
MDPVLNTNIQPPVEGKVNNPPTPGANGAQSNVITPAVPAKKDENIYDKARRAVERNFIKHMKMDLKIPMEQDFKSVIEFQEFLKNKLNPPNPEPTEDGKQPKDITEEFKQLKKEYAQLKKVADELDIQRKKNQI